MTAFPRSPFREELGDGLVMRRAALDDVDQLATYNADLLRAPHDPKPSDFVHAWTREMAATSHPAVEAGDFLLVEDTSRKLIVSSLNLISQTWSYAGIPIGVGRPELVSTHPEYRRRGLVRRMFQELHRWSAERGELMQAITGIPYFYRQFGYEMAVDLDAWRALPASRAPKLKDGEAEPYSFATATEDDIGFVAEVDGEASRRWLMSCPRDQILWRHEALGRVERLQGELAIIRSRDDVRVGFIHHGRVRNGGGLRVRAVEVAPGVSWLAVAPSILRYLVARGRQYPPVSGDDSFDRVVFVLNNAHPLFAAAERIDYDNPAYAWYVRVPDVPAFVRHVAPVLEQRLAESIAVGFSGELALSFYRDGLRLRFDGGRFSVAECFQPPQDMESGAWFPGQTFLQLLFGHRSFDELRATYPDVYGEGDEAPALLKILFPKLPSNLFPIY